MDFVPAGPPDDVEDDDDHAASDQPRPAPWLGDVVPLQLVVARSETGAVAVRDLVAYREGFELVAQAWLRPGTRRRTRGRGDRAVLLQLGLTVNQDGVWPGALVRFGVEWPDGGRATNLVDRIDRTGPGRRRASGPPRASSTRPP